MSVVALQTYLDDFPDDWDARMVLADLLEEQGLETQAAVQRWMVERQLRPYLWGDLWCWFGPDYLPRGNYSVPYLVWAKMREKPGCFRGYSRYISFHSRQEAEKVMEMML